MRRWLVNHSEPLPLAVALAAGLLNAAQPLDVDLWVQLNNGRYLAEFGRMPYPDPFSFSAGDTVWTAHEWLPAWGIYQLIAHGGVGFASLVFGEVFAAIWLVAERALAGAGVKPVWRAAAIGVGAAAMLPFGGIRPLHVGSLCAVAVAALLLRHRRTGDRSVWWTPVVLLVWANSHASFPIGLGLIGLMAADAVWRRLHAQERAPNVRTQVRTLGIVGVLSAAMVLVNPSGPRLWAQPFWQAGNPLRVYNSDWSAPVLGGGTWWAFVGLCAFTAVILVAGRLRLSAVELGAVVTLLGMGFDARKTMALGAAVIPLLLVGPLQALPQLRMPARLSGWLARGLAALTLTGAAVTFGAMGPRTLEGPSVSPMPREARAYLRAQPVARVFNTYHWGAYLTWELWPGTRTYIDGRFDPFAHGPYETYLAITSLEDGWQASLDDLQADAVVAEASAPLAGALAAEPGWRQTFRDGVAAVFVRSERRP
ncbi:MAG: hypothetical protein FJ029_04375 [Actinobacteria bacterium]|nr:hypothetical protein [Actinomycetota bacterium]